jgi:hypothetical protein
VTPHRTGKCKAGCHYSHEGLEIDAAGVIKAAVRQNVLVLFRVLAGIDTLTAAIRRFSATEEGCVQVRQAEGLFIAYCVELSRTSARLGQLDRL